MQHSSSKGDILLVDDMPDNLRLLSTMLGEQGYKTRKVPNGTLALKVVKNAPPDLILLDVMMPDIDGYKVCQNLKADPKTANIPIIFISALDDVFDKVKAFAVGGVDYITKPFHVEEVVARLDNQLTIRNLQKKLQEKNESLQIEKGKSDRLLLNILPAIVAEKLKQHQGSLAEQFDEVTILFADIVGFTALSASMRPIQLVDLLNKIFSTFDRLADRHGLEKIKTIGDAYMVVSGIPLPQENHADAIAQMALEMQSAIQEFHGQDRKPFQLRIGINTGSAVAGVIGIKKFSYDLWGDAVNVASRMETRGEPGKIQVTHETYQHLKDRYRFEERGKISIKGKGEMMTYFLLGKLND
ncbi:adenylate/guanylate cyclase domain-containing protein [Roseofilum casamattae]|uniref:Adenylate/guanylate cyclase domain-containing protein n=1 Tax=Roseofilum casamattae BLCC-M143 TaxID=3022442 RepID=A0ABT7BTB3_9CYAN|nr:adenylate/guanylate cyclase domain-containing protein [Roseofilum casamattae]MDJ1182427.1 adenylate/guanylate cyclase domain-containing protein [Roseofilum casamattae BLCC-M143]